MLVVFAFIYIGAQKELRDAEPFKNGIYLSGKITSPAVYGIVSPRILIPKAWAQKDLTYILAHERGHIARRDNLWRILAVLTAAVHWFNPFVWLFLKQFFAELELACDEYVVKTCSEKQKKEYAHTLLNVLESKKIFTSAFGGAKIHLRIIRILSYKKLSLFSAACFTALAAAIAYTLLTNAA